MLSKFLWGLLSVSVFVFGLPSVAFAETVETAPSNGNVQQGNIKLPLTGTQKNWTKVCGKDQATGKGVCYTTRDFSAQLGKPPLVAFAVYDIAGNDTKIVRLLLPIGLALPPGVHLAIDGGASNDGVFKVCFPKGCFAEASISKATVGAMKKGSILSIGTKNPANNDVIFAVPLEGFGSAFDGPAVDPKVLQEEQQKIQAALQKEAEDRKKRGTTGSPVVPPADSH